MALSSMFSSSTSPVAVDFGTSSVKVLQIVSGDAPSLIAAVELEVPDEIRLDQEKRYEFLLRELPPLIRQARFKGRRAVFSIPATFSHVQHLQVPSGGGINKDDYIKMQLQIQVGLPVSNTVIRSVDVCDTNRGGQSGKETICFATPRDIVMRHVDLLGKCKLEVTGVHAEQHALVWGFNHLHTRAAEQDTTNLYIDLGWGSTKVAISHGRQLTFARSVRVCGQHLDKIFSRALECPIEEARRHRLKRNVPQTASDPALVPVGSTARGAATATAVATHPTRTDADCPGYAEAIETLTEEVCASLRYHQHLYPQRRIDRVIFLGGEARQLDVCRDLADVIGAVAQLGDPLARVAAVDSPSILGLKFGEPQPGWAVACGLCTGQAA